MMFPRLSHIFDHWLLWPTRNLFLYCQFWNGCIAHDAFSLRNSWNGSKDSWKIREANLLRPNRQTKNQILRFLHYLHYLLGLFIFKRVLLRLQIFQMMFYFFKRFKSWASINLLIHLANPESLLSYLPTVLFLTFKLLRAPIPQICFDLWFHWERSFLKLL